MRWIHHQDGSSGLEYAALILLGAVLVFSITVIDPEPDVEDSVRRALCQMFPGDERCEDVEAPGAPGVPEPEPLNRMSLPCLAGREAVGTELSLLFKGVQLDRNAGYTIDQIGTDLFRVTVYGQDALGVGAKGGSKGGSLDSEGNPKGGAFGKGSVLLGGRFSTSYDFGSLEEAEAFVNSRGGPVHALYAASGLPGQLISEAGHWLWRQVKGVFGMDRGPEVSYTSQAVNLRAEGELGYNAGAAGKGELGGMASGVLTQVHGNGWSIFTASLDGKAGVYGIPGTRRRGGVAGAGLGGEGSLRYRVFFDEYGQPLRLTYIQETEIIGRIGGNRGRDRPKGSAVSKWSTEGIGTLSSISITEHSLDLTVPENRAAFDRGFVWVPGLYAHPRGLGSPAGVDPVGQFMIADRLAHDGVTVNYEYLEATGSGMGGGAGAGVTAAELTHERTVRELVSATIVDQRWDDPRPRPFESCWTGAGGPGLPGGGGSPGEGPGP